MGADGPWFVNATDEPFKERPLPVTPVAGQSGLS
jgi:hypothetical protein